LLNSAHPRVFNTRVISSNVRLLKISLFFTASNVGTCTGERFRADYYFLKSFYALLVITIFLNIQMSAYQLLKIRSFICSAWQESWHLDLGAYLRSAGVDSGQVVDTLDRSVELVFL
jgi:hypothetical protein